MAKLTDLRNRLLELDGRGYPAYRSIAGAYAAPGFRLLVDHVQGDPFAEPSRVRALVAGEDAGLPSWALDSPLRRAAAADFLHRALYAACRARTDPAGSGRGGELHVLRPGQEVLARTALLVHPGGAVEARFRAGLPARGRTILGPAAARLLTEAVPSAIEAALLPRDRDVAALRRHVETVEDARALRAGLASNGLVAFVADGAVLPRRSGVDDRPLEGPGARPFAAPAALAVTLGAPHAGRVTGLGVRAGVTLIVGGGFHGKSTLLRALERGVYDHVPGDGRERVVTVSDAVKVRAEDGRAVAGTDIGNFIGRLPGGADTARFTTTNASGSTSQAAAIVEAMEAGTSCLLVDEDTSATNFMIRDARMQALVPGELEPITPFLDRVRQLARDHGISTVMVVGGSGDYFDVADTVLAMEAFLPRDVTAEARRVASERPTGRRAEGAPWRPLRSRVPVAASLEPRRGRRDVHVRAWSADRVAYGTEEVDLSAVPQLVEPAQARAVALALAWARTAVMDGRSVREVYSAVMDHLRTRGLDAVQEYPAGELAEFRAQELAAFLNRIRGFRTDPADP